MPWGKGHTMLAASALGSVLPARWAGRAGHSRHKGSAPLRGARFGPETRRNPQNRRFPLAHLLQRSPPKRGWRSLCALPSQLPGFELKAVNVLKMAVAGHQGQAVAEGAGGDPYVILWNRMAFPLQQGFNDTITSRGFQIERGQGADFNQTIDPVTVGLGISGLFGSEEKLADHGQGKKRLHPAP